MRLKNRIIYYRWKCSSARFDSLGFQFSIEGLSVAQKALNKFLSGPALWARAGGAFRFPPAWIVAAVDHAAEGNSPRLLDHSLQKGSRGTGSPPEVPIGKSTKNARGHPETVLKIGGAGERPAREISSFGHDSSLASIRPGFHANLKPCNPLLQIID